jgi:biopolymer transport protein ExbB/TolQ
MWGELAHSLQHMNGYMWSILAIGTVAAIVLFERIIMLQLVYHIDFPKFLANLRKMVAAEDLDRAITLCKNTSATSLPRIAMRALEAAETDPTRVRGTIEEETIDFLPNIERRLGVLPAFTLLIMLIGILGTIDALWTAFQSIDVLDTAKKQATLAQGIAASLNPTALGLIFGMILLAGYYLIKGMAVNLAERVHYGVTVLTNLLAPQEAMAYMPMVASTDSGSAPAPVSEKTAEEFTPGPKEEAPASSDDSFDDVSVEDIKDEEEII